MSKTLYVQRKAIHFGTHYLKRGDVVPETVPNAQVDAWLKAKFVAETKPSDESAKKKE